MIQFFGRRIVVRFRMNNSSRLINQSKPAKPAIQIKICQTFASRLLGYMFHAPIGDTEGILLSYPRSSRMDSSIHMFFMNFDLAVIWLDENYKVVDKIIAKRWKPYYAPAVPAAHVLETHPERIHDFTNGDQILVEHA